MDEIQSARREGRLRMIRINDPADLIQKKNLNKSGRVSFSSHCNMFLGADPLVTLSCAEEHAEVQGETN